MWFFSSDWLSKEIVDSSTIVAAIAAVLTLLLSAWIIFRDRGSVRCSAFYRAEKGNLKTAKLQIITGRNGARIRSIRLYEYHSTVDLFLNLRRKEVSQELATKAFVTDGLYVEENDARVVLYRLPKRLESAAKDGRLSFHVNTSIGRRRCRISPYEMPALNSGVRR